MISLSIKPNLLIIQCKHNNLGNILILSVIDKFIGVGW